MMLTFAVQLDTSNLQRKDSGVAAFRGRVAAYHGKKNAQFSGSLSALFIIGTKQTYQTCRVCE